MVRAAARPAGEIASWPAAWFLLPGRLQVLLALRRGRGWIKAARRRRAGGAARGARGSVRASRRCAASAFYCWALPAEETWGAGCASRSLPGTRGGVRLEVGEC